MTTQDLEDQYNFERRKVVFAASCGLINADQAKSELEYLKGNYEAIRKNFNSAQKLKDIGIAL